MENKVKYTTIERWEKIGFLDGLNDVQKHNVSEGMEHMANLLINEQLRANPKKMKHYYSQQLGELFNQSNASQIQKQSKIAPYKQGKERSLKSQI